MRVSSANVATQQQDSLETIFQIEIIQHIAWGSSPGKKMLKLYSTKMRPQAPIVH